MFNNNDEPGMFELPDAGKNNFNEMLYAGKFLIALTKLQAPGMPKGGHCGLRTHEKEWYVFNGKAWVMRKRAVFESLALSILPESLREIKNARAVLDHAQMDRQLVFDQQFVGAIRFHSDNAAVLINCNNGVLRVTADSTKLTPHDPEQLFTGCLAADWDEKAEAQLFHKVLDELLPDVQDQALQQWFLGYILYPSCKYEIFLISHGGGGTGKSTISDGVMEVIGGKPMKTVLSMAQICAEGQGAYSLPSLQYAMVNMGTELDTVDIGDSANFKRIVSGEPIEVRPIYGDPYTMNQYTVKLWFNSNSLPRFRHGTDAELRRARFIEFVHPPKVKDVTLKERLAGEKNGILRWMITGLQGVLQGIPCPEGSRESRGVKEKFAISNDPVSAFAKECLIFGKDEEETKDALYEAFGNFLNGWGFPDKSRMALFRQFYERFPEVTAHRERSGKVRKEGQWVLGVRLRERPDDAADAAPAE
jgi:P4 family phage/plasmid primase-like protien